MPTKPKYIQYVELILHYLMLISGGWFKQNAILIKPYQNVNNIELCMFRTERGQSGAEILHFSNGFYFPKPEGDMQYCVIKGKRGAMFGYDGSALWNIKVNNKEQALDMLASVDTEKYITYQSFKEIKDRFESRVEMQRYLVIGLALLAVSGLFSFLIAWVVWDGMSKTKAAEASMASELSDFKRLELAKFAWENNVSFPEYGIIVNWKNKSITGQIANDTLLPTLPTLPQIGGTP